MCVACLMAYKPFDSSKAKGHQSVSFLFCIHILHIEPTTTAVNALPKAMAVTARGMRPTAAGGRRRERAFVQAQENCKRKRSSTTKVPNRMVQAQHEEPRRNKFRLFRFFYAKKSVTCFAVPPFSQKVTFKSAIR